VLKLLNGSHALLILLVLGWPVSVVAQSSDARSTETKADDKPKTQIKVLNVCGLSDSDAQMMASALKTASLKPTFALDFEISRGLTAPKGAVPSRWARVRHDFAAGAPFITAQYSIAADEGGGVIETLVLAPREHKNFMQLSIEAEVSAGNPEQVLAAATPATHIRLERNGANSLVLARCPAANQVALQPLFASATTVLDVYRRALKAGSLAAELSRPDLKPVAAKTP